MKNIKCINCENHANYDMKCNINNENYNKGEQFIKDCFVISDWLKSLDKAIDATDKLIKKLS